MRYIRHHCQCSGQSEGPRNHAACVWRYMTIWWLVLTIHVYARADHMHNHGSKEFAPFRYQKHRVTQCKQNLACPTHSHNIGIHIDHLHWTHTQRREKITRLHLPQAKRTNSPLGHRSVSTGHRACSSSCACVSPITPSHLAYYSHVPHIIYIRLSLLTCICLECVWVYVNCDRSYRQYWKKIISMCEVTECVTLNSCKYIQKRKAADEPNERRFGCS